MSLGHSMATLTTAEQSFRSGASLITHLFNAMQPVGGKVEVDDDFFTAFSPFLPFLLPLSPSSLPPSFLPLQFHHRDPGIVGLLTSQAIGGVPVYYGLIADGNHTDVTVQRIAYKSNPEGEFNSGTAPPPPHPPLPPPPAGVVLVTDAIAAMGLRGRKFSLGLGEVEVVGGTARLAGTDTLAGR